MATIKPISKIDVHRITSGQVVLDLQTAVKELVENALDAGATSIEVRFKDYGAESFEVIDNGSGIDQSNYEGIALKHHTSKLSTFADLAQVQTFGFRGEALSSLCALSDVSIHTATADEAPMGTIIQLDHAGRLCSRDKKAARQRGTSVTVTGLFTSLPVRRKEFEKNLKREYNKAQNLLQAYALISRGVRFASSNQPRGGRRVAQLSLSSSAAASESYLSQNVTGLFGSRVTLTLMPLSMSLPTLGVSVTGLISKPSHGSGRSSADRQFYYVNGRPWEAGRVARAVNEVYRSYNAGQVPFVIADLRLPTDRYDVNVSPDKRTIFLHDESRLIEDLKDALDQLFAPTRGTFRVANGAQSALPFETIRRPVEEKGDDDRQEEQQDPEADSEPEPEPGSPANDEELPPPTVTEEVDAPVRRRELAPKRLVPAPVTRYEPVKRARTRQGPVDVLGSLRSFALPGSQVAKMVESAEETMEANVEELEYAEEGQDEEEQEEIDEEQEALDEMREEQEHVLLHVQDEIGEQVEQDEEQTKEAEAIEAQEEEEQQAEEGEEGEEPKEGKEEVAEEAEENEEEKEETPVPANDCCQSDDEERQRNLAALDQVYDDIVPASVPVPTSSSSALRIDMADLRSRVLASRATVEAESDAQAGPTLELEGAGVSDEDAEAVLDRVIHKDDFARMQVVGQFNLGFIIVRRTGDGMDDLFIVDQHASDEKYNFETLQIETKIKGQKLISPRVLELSATDELVACEHIETLRANGFEVSVEESGLPGTRMRLHSQPVSKGTVFGVKDLEELLYLLRDVSPSSPAARAVRCSKARAMFASRACRKSVMIGTALNDRQMRTILRHMGEIEQPWNCPHGRPTMRHLACLHSLPSDHHLDRKKPDWNKML